MSKTHNTPAYNSNGVRVAPYTERELAFLKAPEGETWAETYRRLRAQPKGPHYRWPTYNEVQDALDAEA